MNSINNILLLSLKHDLKSLHAINLQILQHLPSFRVKSWLFPTKKGTDISTDVEKIDGDNQYLRLLEHIIDKFYLMINLMVTFLDQAVRRQLPVKCVKTPNNLSLGSASKVLWQKLENLKSSDLHKVKFDLDSGDKNNSITNEKSSQTSFDSIECKNCALSINCVITIMEELENYAYCTNVGEMRQNLKEDIYNMSKYGCLNRISTEIVKEIGQQMENLKTLQLENKQLKAEINEKRLKHSDSLTIIKKTNQSLQRVQTLSKNEVLKNESLKKRINYLMKNNNERENEIKCYKQQIRLLEQSASTHTADLALIITDNQILKTSLDRVQLEKANLEEESTLWKRKFNDVYSENAVLADKVNSLEKSEVFQKSMDQINDACQRVSEKLLECNVEIQKKTGNLEKLGERIVGILDSHNINENEISSEIKSPVQQKLSGNPVVDMEQQMEINMASIQQLEDDNCVLQQTITKIKKKVTFSIPN